MEYNDKLVGYLYRFIRNNGDTYNKIVSILDALYVDEEYRNMKIGNNLINEFKKWCTLNNVHTIEVSVCSLNDAAVNLYSKQGFKNIKEVMNTEI